MKTSWNKWIGLVAGLLCCTASVAQAQRYEARYPSAGGFNPGGTQQQFNRGLGQAQTMQQRFSPRPRGPSTTLRHSGQAQRSFRQGQVAINT